MRLAGTCLHQLRGQDMKPHVTSCKRARLWVTWLRLVAVRIGRRALGSSGRKSSPLRLLILVLRMSFKYDGIHHTCGLLCMCSSQVRGWFGILVPVRVPSCRRNLPTCRATLVLVLERRSAATSAGHQRRSAAIGGHRRKTAENSSEWRKTAEYGGCGVRSSPWLDIEPAPETLLLPRWLLILLIEDFLAQARA
jgi:hypothetical protein